DMSDGDTLDFSDLEAFEVASDGGTGDAHFGIEILNGIPAPQPSGYTELLRNIDDETLIDVPSQAEPVGSVDPDATGEPLAFEELIEVTSSDGTGPLVSTDAAPESENPFDFANTDLEAALPPESGDPIGLDLAGIEPFDSSSFGEAAAQADAYDFGVDPATEPAPAADEGLVVEVVPEAVAPFTFDEVVPTAEADAPFDFGDVEAESVAPFAFEDAATVADEANAATAEPEPFHVEPEAAPVEVQPEAEPMVAEEVASDASEEPEPMAARAVEPVAGDQAQPAWAGREGLGDVARKVLWPQFVNQTSTLIDRAMESENLFERIAAQKAALQEMGVVGPSRPLRVFPVYQAVAPEAAEAPVAAAESQTPPPSPARTMPEMSEQTRMDLMGMRIRLVEDEDSAVEIAAAVERAISEGLHAPLAMRVLGEAYLKMGMVERAAAQFRQAMLARRKSA
ncbi:MAG: hypothetical protein M3Y37_08275, partial [Chloroflexota bacterium]|nr:hypothetical protein [Chloroflexota bacterium]